MSKSAKTSKSKKYDATIVKLEKANIRVKKNGRDLVKLKALKSIEEKKLVKTTDAAKRA